MFEVPWKCIILFLGGGGGGEVWRSGESTRLPPLWPGFKSGVEVYVGWVCCWFSPLLRKVFLWVIRFSHLRNTPTLPNFNWILKARTRFNQFSWTPKRSVGKQITCIFFNGKLRLNKLMRCFYWSVSSKMIRMLLNVVHAGQIQKRKPKNW